MLAVKTVHLFTYTGHDYLFIYLCENETNPGLEEHSPAVHLQFNNNLRSVLSKDPDGVFNTKYILYRR